MVILLVLGFLVAGAVIALPSRSPLGSMIGKMASNSDLLSAMMASTSPKAVAQAINENPGFLRDLLQAMAEQGTVQVLAEAINQNPTMLLETSRYLDAAAIAGPINEHADLLIELVKALDTQVVVDAVNQNGRFLAELLRHLDAQALSKGINENALFLTNLISYLDPQVVAEVVNHNGPFLSDLMGRLDPASSALVINLNAPFFSALVGYLDPAVIAGVINNNEPFLTASMSYIDPAVIAQAINANGPFLSRMMGYLNPAVLANALNRNADMVVTMTTLIDQGLIIRIINQSSLIGASMDYMNPQAVAGALNASTAFINQLVSLLDENLIKELIDSSMARAQEISEKLDPQFMGGLMSNQAMLSRIMAALNNPTDLAKLAVILNSPEAKSFVEQVIANLDENAGYGMGAGLNPDFLRTLLDHLDGEKLAQALNAHPNFLAQLLVNLNGATGRAMAEGTNLNANNFLGRLIARLEPAVVAYLVNHNADFIAAVVKNTTTNTAAQVAEGINANVAAHPGGGDLLSVVIANITPEVATTLAQALNENVAPGGIYNNQNLLLGLLPNMNGASGARIGLGLSDNPDFLKTLIQNISADTATALADAINLDCAEYDPANPATKENVLLIGLLSTLKPSVAIASAQGMNDNVALVAAVINNLSTDTAVKVALVLNALPVGPAGNPFINGLMGALDANTAAVIAQGMNNKPELADAMIKELNDGPGLAMIANAINNNSAFLAGLISNLNGGVIAGALNGEYAMRSPQIPSLLERIMPQMNGADLAKTLNDYGHDFLLGLISNLDGAVVAQGMNNLTDAGKTKVAQLIAYMDPYLIADLVNQTATGAYITGQLWVKAYAYRSNLGLPAPLVFKIRKDNLGVAARVQYDPPPRPPWPFWW